MLYKGYEIDMLFGYITVLYCGDEVVFTDVDDAKKFIDEITEDEEVL